MYRTADISGLSRSLVQRYISAVRYTNVNGIVLFFISVVPVVVGELYYYYVAVLLLCLLCVLLLCVLCVLLLCVLCVLLLCVLLLCVLCVPVVVGEGVWVPILQAGGPNSHFKYRPFHKTLPRSSAFVNWISVRFYETYIKSTKSILYSYKKTDITGLSYGQLLEGLWLSLYGTYPPLLL